MLCGGVGSVSGVRLLNGGRQELSLSLLEEQLLLGREESGKLVESRRRSEVGVMRKVRGYEIKIHRSGERQSRCEGQVEVL